MPLPVLKFTAYLEPKDDGEPVEVEVTVKHRDRLKAEVALAQLGISQELPQHLTTAWVWAALAREEAYSGPLSRFMNTDCAGIEVPDSEESEDPTQPAPVTDSP